MSFCSAQVYKCCDTDRGIKEVTVGDEKFIRCDGTKAHNVFVNSVRSTDGTGFTGSPCLVKI